MSSGRSKRKNNEGVVNMGTYSLQDIAKITGVTRQTIYNWMHAGVIEEPDKNYRGYRKFTDRHLKTLLDYKNRPRNAGDSQQ